MEKLNIPEKYKNILHNFVQGLKDIYQEDIVSLTLYGSAVSGEFVDQHSNLNLLVVLKNTDLKTLKKSSQLIRKFKMINALFLTEGYIAASTHVFPIEFLDMQENHHVLYGRDSLKDLRVDMRNLRFQCEQELKAKLLKLKQAYLRLQGSSKALQDLLFLAFTSILHILKNVLRLKGKKPPYLKQDVLKELANEFKMNVVLWQKILAAKNKHTKLNAAEIEQLFVDFVQELESMVALIDKL